jgi:hypothetical protein
MPFTSARDLQGGSPLPASLAVHTPHPEQVRQVMGSVLTHSMAAGLDAPDVEVSIPGEQSALAKQQAVNRDCCQGPTGRRDRPR